MDKNIKEKVVRLFKEGFTKKEIVEEVSEEASPASVYRWLSDYEASEYLSGLESDTEIQEPLSNENSAYVEITGKKRRILKQFLRLFKEIYTHATGFRWTNQQLEGVLTQLTELQEDVERLFGYDKDECESNALWVALNEYIDLFEDWKIAGGDVEIDMDEKELNDLRYYLSIEDFDSQYDYHADYERQFGLTAKRVLSLNGTSLYEETADELKKEVDNLKELNEKNGLSGYNSGLDKCLSGLSQEVDRVNSGAKDSFWGKRLELPEEVEETLEGLVNEES